MPADIFRQRMNDDIGAEIERTAQERRGDRVVDDQWYAVAMGDFRELFDVHDIASRVTDRFAKDRFGVFIDQAVKSIEIITWSHTHVHALARQGVHEQIIGAAIKLAYRHDVIARPSDR